MRPHYLYVYLLSTLLLLYTLGILALGPRTTAESSNLLLAWMSGAVAIRYSIRARIRGGRVDGVFLVRCGIMVAWGINCLLAIGRTFAPVVDYYTPPPFRGALYVVLIYGSILHMLAVGVTDGSRTLKENARETFGLLTLGAIVCISVILFLREYAK